MAAGEHVEPEPQAAPGLLMLNGEALTETALMICDRCLRTMGFGHYETLRRLAGEQGWWFPSGFDICPACVPGDADR